MQILQLKSKAFKTRFVFNIEPIAFAAANPNRESAIIKAKKQKVLDMSKYVKTELLSSVENTF
jgi:hypothetical protein